MGICTASLLSIFVIAAPREPLQLWLYHSTNLWVDANIDRLESVWRRAAKAGYKKVLLADSKFAKLGDLDARYFKNIERIRKLAGELGLEIVPALFSLGYSNDLLWHGPDLAEGLPVKDSLFVVKGGEARLVADPPVSFPSKPSWQDKEIVLDGHRAEVENNLGNARLVQKISVAPFRCYHISVDVRTEDYTGQPEVKVLAGGRSLQYQSLGVRRSQDWKPHHVVFDSLEHEEVAVYFGVWGGARGKLAWRNWKIEEVGLLNVLRRPGAPCVVEGCVDGCVEGRDYEPIADPRMGNRPWNGAYEVWHEPPAIKTGLPDGTKLRVSWFFPPIIHDEQVMCCPSEPRVSELLGDQARRMREAWRAKGYMMSFDEIRCLNWDMSCRDRNLSPGEILARSAQECAGFLDGSTAYVWSDMFDPHHNARKDYYLVRGDLGGSWEGLPKTAVVVNWNFDGREKSLRFFAERGHRQVIAGYYDAPPSGVKKWLAAAEGVPGVEGIMYTTWQSRYEDREEFARLCRGVHLRD